jgi:uncharacterized membrane protein
MQPSIFEQAGRRPSALQSHRDMADVERLICGLAGMTFLVNGIKRRGWEGVAIALLGGALLYMGATGRNALYRHLGIHLVRTANGRQRCEVIRSFTINRPIGELFAFWRDLSNLPKFMSHLTSVEVLSDKRSRWKAKGPAGLPIEWEAEIVNEKADSLIAWQSCEGSSVANWGVIRFKPAPGGRGTEISVQLEYEPIGGATGVALAKLFGEEPSQQIEEDLRHFKQMMEAGEIPTTAGQPRGGAAVRFHSA